MNTENNQSSLSKSTAEALIAEWESRERYHSEISELFEQQQKQLVNSQRAAAMIYRTCATDLIQQLGDSGAWSGTTAFCEQTDESETFHCICGATHLHGAMNAKNVFRCLKCGKTIYAPRVDKRTQKVT